MATTTTTTTTKPVASKASKALAATAPQAAPAPVAPNVAAAPITGVVGHKAHGGHYLAYAALRKAGIPTSAVVALVKGTANPWRPGTQGSTFYVQVLSALPQGATVQAMCQLANSTMGLKPVAAINHLAWLYTYSAAYVTLNGQVSGTVAATQP